MAAGEEAQGRRGHHVRAGACAAEPHWRLRPPCCLPWEAWTTARAAGPCRPGGARLLPSARPSPSSCGRLRSAPADGRAATLSNNQLLKRQSLTKERSENSPELMNSEKLTQDTAWSDCHRPHVTHRGHGHGHQISHARHRRPEGSGPTSPQRDKDPTPPPGQVRQEQKLPGLGPREGACRAQWRRRAGGGSRARSRALGEAGSMAAPHGHAASLPVSTLAKQHCDSGISVSRR